MIKRVDDRKIAPMRRNAPFSWLAAVASVLFASGCTSPPDRPASLQALPECGWLPNCVNSQSGRGVHATEPLRGTGEDWKNLKAWILRQEDWEITVDDGSIRTDDLPAMMLHGDMAQNGSPLTAWAFREGLGRTAGGRGHLLVTLAVFLFGLSTAISWSYYGDRAVFYLFGPRWTLPYRVVFCVMHFLGAVYSLELVWAFGDMALGLMTLPNLLSILLLTGKVKLWTKEYVDHGKLEPPAR